MDDMTHPRQPVGVAVLGSTGSIGTQALDVIARMPERFRVVSLAARRLSEELLGQTAQHRPELVAVAEDGRTPEGLAGRWVAGPEALMAAATHPDADIVLAATSGHDAILPTMRAIELGKTIAIANKETIVCAGELVMPLAQAAGRPLRPVDSEHSALWQALGGAVPDQVSRLILTASGGPFRATPAADLARVTREQTLAHPTWNMGGKITVDSATLMNKGLEIIEARWLFDIPYERIDVVVHSESIVHSLVEFRDGSQIAQLSLPDMRMPIQYALTWPERLPSPCRRLSLAECGALTFEPPDVDRFPALRLAREAGQAGSTYPTVLSAADDVAVEAFLDGRIGFTAIPETVSRVLDAHAAAATVTLDAILDADAWARRETARLLAGT